MNTSNHKTRETHGSYIKDDRILQPQQDETRLESDTTQNDIYASSYNSNESYVDEYQKRMDEEGDYHDYQILNEEEDPDDLDDNFEDALDRENEDDDYFEEDDLDKELDESDLDDDLIEDYDENDREPDSFTTEKLKQDELDQEYDIDQDLEEKDPVNKPREF
jgi:hypothetical protein